MMKFSVEEACRSTCWKPASITGLEVSFRTTLVDERLESQAIVFPAALLMIPDRGSDQQTESVESGDSQVHIEINPWPVLWMVVGAWMWFGVLHLARVI
jgi:hypothetical protein